MKMVASMDFPYDGKEIKTGDEFEATDKDSSILKLYGRAELAEEEVPRVKRRYKRRDMRVEE